MDLKKFSSWLGSVVLIMTGPWIMGKYVSIFWEADSMIVSVLVSFVGVIFNFILLLGGQSTDTQVSTKDGKRYLQGNTTGQGIQLALQQGMEREKNQLPAVKQVRHRLFRVKEVVEVVR